MTGQQHAHCWVDYWTEQARIARGTHNTERLMWAERQRALALRCERCAA